MNRSLKGICFTVAGGCCWGMSGVMGKYLFDAKDLTATWLVTVRLLGAGIMRKQRVAGLRHGALEALCNIHALMVRVNARDHP